MPFGLEIFFKVYFATAISHYLCIVDVGFHVRVVEKFSGIDVNDMLHLRKKRQLFFHMILHACSIWACHRNLFLTLGHNWGERVL